MPAAPRRDRRRGPSTAAPAAGRGSAAALGGPDVRSPPGGPPGPPGTAGTDVAGFFAGHPGGPAVHRRILVALGAWPDVQVRVTPSQVAYRRRRAFAWLWLPGRWLRRPTADVVLSVALGRHDRSPRFKEVVHPSRTTWMHHLEIRRPEDVDDEVVGWLAEAAARAGGRRER